MRVRLISRSPTGCTLAHAFTDPGDYSVTLTTTDMAYGRFPDGGAWGALIEPTPGTTNNKPPPVIDQVALSSTARSK